jgi:hypothetical protein
VAQLAAEGESNSETAAQLYISPHTVSYRWGRFTTSSKSDHATSSVEPWLHPGRAEELLLCDAALDAFVRSRQDRLVSASIWADPGSC